MTTSFLPYFRNEFRESGSIYGNIGSWSSRFCPLESFKWFLRNLFPWRHDLEKFTQQSHWGPHTCSRMWLLAWCCPREKCEKASSGPLFRGILLLLPVPDDKSGTTTLGNSALVELVKMGMLSCVSLTLKICYRLKRRTWLFKNSGSLHEKCNIFAWLAVPGIHGLLLGISGKRQCIIRRAWQGPFFSWTYLDKYSTH